MTSFLMIFDLIVSVIFWIILAQVILSWLVAFDVVNVRQKFVHQLWTGLHRITEPIYRPIRNVLPDMGGIDFTPMIVLIGLYALQIIVWNNLGPVAYG